VALRRSLRHLPSNQHSAVSSEASRLYLGICARFVWIATHRGCSVTVRSLNPEAGRNPADRDFPLATFLTHPDSRTRRSRLKVRATCSDRVGRRLVHSRRRSQLLDRCSSAGIRWSNRDNTSGAQYGITKGTWGTDGDAFRSFGKDGAVTMTRHLDQPDVAEAARSLRHLLQAVRAKEVAAPADAVARLQGAVIALEAVAVGRTPDPDALLVPGPYAM
jgi:hypothetical protein